jgi:hypothetical protein
MLRHNQNYFDFHNRSIYRNKWSSSPLVSATLRGFAKILKISGNFFSATSRFTSSLHHVPSFFCLNFPATVCFKPSSLRRRVISIPMVGKNFIDRLFLFVVPSSPYFKIIFHFVVIIVFLFLFGRSRRRFWRARNWRVLFNVAGRRPFGEFGRDAFYICHCFNSNTKYPQTSNAK